MTESVQSAGAPADAKPTLWQKLSKWIIAICGLVAGGLGLVKFADQFTLPGCEAERTTTTVRDIFKSKDIELVTLDGIKPVTDTRQEKTCTAHIESKDETATIDYKVFWEGWTVKVLIQTVRDEKPR
jgi:hypothetical protein